MSAIVVVVAMFERELMCEQRGAKSVLILRTIDVPQNNFERIEGGRKGVNRY